VVSLIKSTAAYRQREHQKEQAFLQGLLNGPADLSAPQKRE
jgi:hypothetical protein